MMTDEEFDRLCDEYKAMHMEWAWRLGLQWWDFRFEFYRGPIPHFGEERTADMDSKWEYQLGLNRVNIVNWEGQAPIDREETVVHELVHCILAPLRPRSESHRRRALEENATTTLARALLGRMHMPEAGNDEPPRD